MIPTCRRFSSKTPSTLKSDHVFSSDSKEKCIARIMKMKSYRPTNIEVKQRAAVLVPLVDISGSPHILFTRRSLSLSSHRGQVSFPGGKEDPGDGDLTRTALRCVINNKHYTFFYSHILISTIHTIVNAQGDRRGARNTKCKCGCLVSDARAVIQSER